MILTRRARFVVWVSTFGLLAASAPAATREVYGTFQAEFVGTDPSPWMTGEWSGTLSGGQATAAQALERFLRGARASMSAAIYGVENQEWFFTFLRSKVKSGLDARFVVDQDKIGDDIGYTYPDTAELAQILPRTRFLADINPDGSPRVSSIMHNKFIVVDHKAVWMGSTNITATCLGDEYNANTSLVIRSPELARIYEGEFDQMFVEKKFSRAKKSREDADTLRYSDGTEVDVFFSPQDDPVAKAVVPFIEASTRRLDIAMFFMTSSPVRQALVAAAKRGVEIRVMLDAVAASSKFSIHKALREAGIEVRVEIMGGKMHAKTAVADGEHVLIGSMNWTAAGTADNDENTLWIRGNEKLAGEIGDWFESIWQWMPEVSGSDPKPEGLDSVNSCADGIDNDYDFQTDASDSGCRS